MIYPRNSKRRVEASFPKALVSIKVDFKRLKTPAWDLKEMLNLPLIKGKQRKKQVDLINQTPSRKTGEVDESGPYKKKQVE